jgi:hypothetical protein
MRTLVPSLLLAAASAAITSPISLQWAGYSWSVKTGGPLDPGANTWVPSLARVDAATGALSLAIAPLDPSSCNGRWGSSEVWLNEPLGWGTYIFHVTFPLSVSGGGPLCSRDARPPRARWPPAHLPPSRLTRPPLYPPPHTLSSFPRAIRPFFLLDAPFPPALAPSPTYYLLSQLDIHAVFAAFVWDDDVGEGSGRYPPFDPR